MPKRHTALGGTLLTLALLAGLSHPALAQASGDVEFGDDTSEWANDGECDDPRFTGEGMAAELLDTDRLKDATDCRTLFEDGSITLIEDDADTGAAAETAAPRGDEEDAEVDFGDDSSEWANDGECDDPRFAGEGMAEELLDADRLKDATDCRTLFEEGSITLADEPADDAAAIDFGDDTSEWANDQECDDPRFVGTGMAGELDDANIGRDATDCENAFNDGTITLAEDGGEGTGGAASTDLALLANRIDFGDDSGEWPNDGECDDPDFVGPNAVSNPSDVNRLADATDCRASFIAGTVTLKGTGAGATAEFDYGSDFSQWANDGQCDDWRFTGAGMAKKLTSEDVLGDASDCRALAESGEISIKPVYQPDYAVGAPYDGSDVDFGDNSSTYANDDICDDPRFEGPGVASTLLDSDIRADAVDCQAAFEAGTATLRDGQS